MAAKKVGPALAKVLGIKLDYRDPLGKDGDLSRGESVFSVSSADHYAEEEPTAIEWLREIAPTRGGVLKYLHDLFPFTKWILRYNLLWLAGDLVAGM